jgi:hypothetical protein
VSVDARAAPNGRRQWAPLASASKGCVPCPGMLPTCTLSSAIGRSDRALLVAGGDMSSSIRHTGIAADRNDCSGQLDCSDALLTVQVRSRLDSYYFWAASSVYYLEGRATSSAFEHVKVNVPASSDACQRRQGQCTCQTNRLLRNLSAQRAKNTAARRNNLRPNGSCARVAVHQHNPHRPHSCCIVCCNAHLRKPATE